MTSNKDFAQARKMMVRFYKMAKRDGDTNSMRVIAKIIDLYDSAFDEVTMRQAELAILNYRGAQYEGDYMGLPADEMVDTDD
jgi:hypothetical protein